MRLVAFLLLLWAVTIQSDQSRSQSVAKATESSDKTGDSNRKLKSDRDEDDYDDYYYPPILPGGGVAPIMPPLVTGFGPGLYGNRIRIAPSTSVSKSSPAVTRIRKRKRIKSRRGQRKGTLRGNRRRGHLFRRRGRGRGRRRGGRRKG